jgi:hypothetical protein
MAKTPNSAFPDCDDADNNGEIVKKHDIGQTEHNDNVQAFFGSLNPRPAELFMDDSVIDYSLDCEYYGIKISFDARNHTDNGDIRISMGRLTDLQAPHTDSLNIFSINLFKGLRDSRNVVKLEIRKGYRNDGGLNIPSIMLIGLDSLGTPRFYGDLSSTFPIFNL